MEKIRFRDPGWKNPDPGFGIYIPDLQAFDNISANLHFAALLHVMLLQVAGSRLSALHHEMLLLLHAPGSLLCFM